MLFIHLVPGLTILGHRLFLVMQVVVGIDLSETSEALIRRGAAYASKSGVHLKLVHVIGADDLDRYLESNPGQDKDALVANVETRCKEFVEGLKLAGVEYEVHVELGQPFKVLCEAVESHGKDLLMLSAHEKGKSVAGPTATRCVRRAAADVLLVRDSHPEPYKKFLVCTDFSDNSRNALARAIEFVKVQGCEQFEIAHVIYPPDKDFYGPVVRDFADRGKSYGESVHDEARARMEAFFKPFVNAVPDLPVTFTVLESTTPAHVITSHVLASGIDLVALGTTGRGAVFGLKLGSNAERLLNAAPCSVFAVKSD